MASVFDQFDDVLNQAQRAVFSETITIAGLEVAAIADEVLTFLGDVQTTQTVWTVEHSLLPAGFGRGTQVVHGDNHYQVGRIHPKDGTNQAFELERQ